MRGDDAGECRLCNDAFEYFDKVNNGLLLGIAELVKRGGRGWIGEVRARASTMTASTKEVFSTGYWCRKVALFWRCARLWSSGHKVGNSNIVWEKDLNTSRQPHWGPKCGGQRSS